MLLRYVIIVLLFMRATAAAQAVDVTVDPRDRGKPFRGWGTSLAWWANGVGDWPDESLDRVVKLVTDPHDGLGLSVFRYNIGGGDDPTHHHMRRWGDVPGFKPTADAPYDWNTNARQRRVLLKLIKASATRPTLEAFSNSAPWWMTISGCASGAADGGANLAQKNEPAFAAYLADVVRQYRDRYSVTFDSLAPMNEPDVNWWRAGHNQEGMHVGREQQARLIQLMRRALDERGMRDTIVSATDANSVDDCLASVLSFDADMLAALGRINTHSYSGNRHAELRAAAAERGKPLWQSESGPLNVRGSTFEKEMLMAQRIVRDINSLRPETWCTWQIIDVPGWGVLNPIRGVERDFRIGKKFYVLAPFTRYIRPGDRLVNLDREDVLVGVSEPRGEVAVVFVNTQRNDRSFRVSFKDAKPVGDVIAAVCTTETTDLAGTPAECHSGVLTVTTPAASVTAIRLRYGDREPK
jgi:hypothetical protein